MYGNPGSVDITTNMHCDQVIEAGNRFGLNTMARLTQRQWLLRFGIRDELAQLERAGEHFPPNVEMSYLGVKATPRMHDLSARMLIRDDAVKIREVLAAEPGSFREKVANVSRGFGDFVTIVQSKNAPVLPSLSDIAARQSQPEAGRTFH
jgi:SAM-dependent MidA family methyltransferase